MTNTLYPTIPILTSSSSSVTSTVTSTPITFPQLPYHYSSLLNLPQTMMMNINNDKFKNGSNAWLFNESQSMQRKCDLIHQKDLLTTLSESNSIIQLFTQLIVLKLNEEEIDWLKMMILFSSTSGNMLIEQLMHLIQTIYSCISIKCNLPMNWLKYYIECIFQLNNEQFNLIIKQMIFTAIETSEMLMMTTPSTQLPPPPTTTTTTATTTNLH
uniref:Uncharacterized protein n=1 Tax=Schistosoma haematobium TaxID=6185 RepID=A0A094ZUK4_SCHHA